jgi:hypothetical protein
MTYYIDKRISCVWRTRDKNVPWHLITWECLSCWPKPAKWKVCENQDTWACLHCDDAMDVMSKCAKQKMVLTLECFCVSL